ncbi:MAG: hypothetical protein Q8922_06225 [Bacteroidota bacterium]|nr:hypothetical protein [Bacteroidota bacterium]MDP4233754.1 hypothetical protein [Bacteroidota bacterium]MDP4287515.1 hypothetical protein [Bacteroidota bacterium]
MRIPLRLFLFFGLVALAAPAFAQVHLSINIGPPLPRHEVVVRSVVPGAIWIPGYYTYSQFDEDYAWHTGRWEAPPAPHQIWVAPRYVHRGTGYDYYEGGWRDNGKHKGQFKQRGGAVQSYQVRDNPGRGNNNPGRGNEGHGNKGNGNEGHGNEGHGNGNGHGRDK